tara:strand:+ start:71 stop:223 length:153 start_codon:yes stop_codon:yes gene_type:complete
MNIEAITEYVYNNYKNLKDKPLIILEADTHYTVQVNKDESPMILSKQILN